MAKQPQRPAQQSAAPARKTAPAPTRRASENKDSLFSTGSNELIYGRQNFILMGAGLLLVLLGLAAMSGGAMPDPSKWESERIYAFRRITLAPVLMVSGFVVVIWGIFKKNKVAEPASPISDAE